MQVPLQKQQNDVEINKPASQEDRIAELEIKLASLAKMLYLFKRSGLPKKKEEVNKKNNIEGIPVNTCYLGYTKGSIYPYILVVNEEGKFNIGDKEFSTLSDATEFVCGQDTDSLKFWQTIEGMPLGEFIK